LGIGLKRLKFLENFKLRFAKCGGGEPNDEAEGMRMLTQSMKNMVQLKKDIMDFEGSSCMGNQSLIILNEIIGSVPSLQSIRLNFACCYGVSDEGLKSLEKLKENTNLKEVHFDFAECEQITDQGLLSVADFIQNRPGLKTIYLNFLNCQQITDNSLCALGQALRVQTSLKDLTLVFESCCNGTDIGFGSISDALKGLTNLESVDFNLSRSECLSNQFCYNLATTIVNLPITLKKIKLNLLSCPFICDKGVASLSEGFKKLPLLEIITLMFYS